MFVCSFCGHEHEEDRKFCPETGDRIEHCSHNWGSAHGDIVLIIE